ncbi:MAG: AI-2E family transporter, partial [Clostridia bacterium]|nr:AI-2E family transporter [Clostridia bacterium]
LSRTLWVECKELFEDIPIYFKSLTAKLEAMMQKNEGIFAFIPDAAIENVIQYITEYDYSSLVTGSLGSHLIGYAGNVVIYIPNALIFLIVTIVSSIFMSISLPTVKAFVLAQFKPKTQSLIIDIKHNLFSTVGKYLLSYSLLMFMTFVELFIFFLIFDFNSPLILALVIAVVDILPILGVGTILIPWSVISLISGEPITALILICIYIVITVVRQIMEPKVI